MASRKTVHTWEMETRRAIEHAFTCNGLRASDSHAVKLDFSTRMHVAMGCAHVEWSKPERSRYSISFSVSMFSVVTYDERCNTAIHEACHVVAWIKNGRRVSSHGSAWCSYMRAAGEDPTRLHKMRPKTAVDAHCPCGKVQYITARRAKKMGGNSYYTCKRCNGRIALGAAVAKAANTIEDTTTPDVRESTTKERYMASKSDLITDIKLQMVKTSSVLEKLKLTGLSDILGRMEEVRKRAERMAESGGEIVLTPWQKFSQEKVKEGLNFAEVAKLWKKAKGADTTKPPAKKKAKPTPEKPAPKPKATKPPKEPKPETTAKPETTEPAPAKPEDETAPAKPDGLVEVKRKPDSSGWFATMTGRGGFKTVGNESTSKREALELAGKAFKGK